MNLNKQRKGRQRGSQRALCCPADFFATAMHNKDFVDEVYFPMEVGAQITHKQELVDLPSILKKKKKDVYKSSIFQTQQHSTRKCGCLLVCFISNPDMIITWKSQWFLVSWATSGHSLQLCDKLNTSITTKTLKCLHLRT